MLTVTQLHNKRATKMLHRKTLLKTRQARIARLKQHVYAQPKYVTLMPASRPSILGKLAARIKELIRRRK